MAAGKPKQKKSSPKAKKQKKVDEFDDEAELLGKLLSPDIVSLF